MASIHKNGKYWHIFFRLGGEQFKPSLKTTSDRTAENLRGVVEDTIKQLEMGRLSLPAGAARSEIIRFVLSGGRQSKRPMVADRVALKRVIDEYFAACIAGKEETTIAGERIHTDHFLRILGQKSAFARIDTARLQTYAAKRSTEKGLRGRKVSPETIKKEFRTFNQIWKMAVAKGYVSGPSPTKGVKLALIDEKPPFMTWDEIETIIKRGGLTEEQQKAYWDCLFLDEKQVSDLLEYVREHAEHPFIYAAVSFAAFTGARRSEIVPLTDRRLGLGAGGRSNPGEERQPKEEDHFPRGQHPRKSRSRHEGVVQDSSRRPFRHCPSAQHGEQPKQTPGAVTADSRSSPRPLRRTIAGSKWKVLKGWHVLRHSFCSNCARRGVPDTIIDVWMGHRGDEDIKKRYRHLFPSDTRGFMGRLFAD